MDPTLFNRSSPTLFLFRGQYMTAKEIAELTGLKQRTVYRRFQFGHPIEGKPRFGPQPRLIMFRGEKLTIAQIQERTGLSRSQVSKRTCADRFFERDELSASWGEPHPNARLIFHDCRTQSVSAWSRETRIPRHVITDRLNRGWPVKEALTTPAPIRVTLLLRHDGKAMSISHWAAELGCAKTTISKRIFVQGLSIDRALSDPIIRPCRAAAPRCSAATRRAPPGGGLQLSATPRGPAGGHARTITKSNEGRP